MDFEEQAKREFLESYQNYSDAIFRHLYFRILDRELAKELMQETFMKTWQYVVDGKKIDNIRALLYRIANNLIIDHIRKKKETSLDSLLEKGFQPSKNEENSVKDRIDMDIVVKLIDHLPPKYHHVIVMRYVDDLSIEEIANILGESKNSVSVQINRGLKQLKVFFKKYKYE